MALQTGVQFPSQPALECPRFVELESSARAQMAGVSEGWRKLMQQAEIAAPHIQVASIEGEAGAGKQTLARFLHDRSSVSRSPFKRRDAREWLATEADTALLSGFIYLDRVDLLPPLGQGLLLGVLRALNENPQGHAVLVTSSQTSLRQMTAQGLFTPDLAFRLTAVRFAIPPLRQRGEDIAPLAQALLDRICSRYQQRPVALGPGALARLLQHNWPGNVRELASVLEAALLEAANGVIRSEDLLISSRTELRLSAQPDALAENLDLHAVIQRHVQYVLGLNHGNKLRSARQLGISRSTLYRILGNESILAR
jgi:two-component system response regulator AtoC